MPNNYLSARNGAPRHNAYAGGGLDRAFRKQCPTTEPHVRAKMKGTSVGQHIHSSFFLFNAFLYASRNIILQTMGLSEA